MARNKEVAKKVVEFIESIEKIKVFKVNKGSVFATATFTFDNGLVVPGFTIFQKDGQRWLSLPSVKKGDTYAPAAWFDKDFFTEDEKAQLKTMLTDKICSEVEE